MSNQTSKTRVEAELSDILVRAQHEFVALCESWETNRSGNTHGHGHRLIPNSGAVMISAPHATEQTRGGKVKQAEPFTGALALALSYAAHCPVIVKTGNSGDDPNDDESSVYRDELCAYASREKVRVVLDLHQMSPKREHNVMIGSGEGRNVFSRSEIVSCLTDAFSSHGIDKVGVDEYFRALGANTVSAYCAANAQVPAVQIEINSQLIFPGCDESAPLQLLGALVDAAERLQNIERGSLRAR